jgi:class 3 adenylate cyclase
VLATHNRIVRTNLRSFGGTEIKAQGDGFMLTFTSARRAVQFAVSVQQELARWSRDNPEEAVRIRIGAHTGEAIMDDEGDLFGKHIIVAARIANLADGAEILVSNVVREITSSRGDIRFGQARPVTLKGIEGEHEVSEVLWEP